MNNYPERVKLVVKLTTRYQEADERTKEDMVGKLLENADTNTLRELLHFCCPYKSFRTIADKQRHLERCITL